MKVLDLFCCAGCASDGYAQAGFEVTGVDVRDRRGVDRRRHYPYSFVQADALAVLRGETAIRLADYDLIHASPPCQTHSQLNGAMKAQGGVTKAVDCLAPTLRLLHALGRPFVVENVPPARRAVEHLQLPGVSTFVLCGSMFGLRVRRHRVFWTNVAIPPLQCNHLAQEEVVGVYGSMNDHVKGINRKTGRYSPGGRTARNSAEAHEAMGMARKLPWSLLKEGLPPAYTKYIGEQVKLKANK